MELVNISLQRKSKGMMDGESDDNEDDEMACLKCEETEIQTT